MNFTDYEKFVLTTALALLRARAEGVVMEYREMEILLAKIQNDSPPILGISISGGMVAGVFSEDPDYFKNQRVMVVDYDVADDEDTYMVDVIGSPTPVYLETETVGKAPVPVNDLWRQYTGEDS